MEKVKDGHAITFNGPLEAGVRAVAILHAGFPASYDIQRLVAFDYLLVRTEQLGGPDNLHPAGPINAPVTDVRRKLVQSALLLMMARGLVVREIDAGGFRYKAGETASLFVESLRSPYLCALRDRAVWLVKYFADQSDEEFDAQMRQFYDGWVVEFQSVESSLGVDI
jgi:hypothetical protein